MNFHIPGLVCIFLTGINTVTGSGYSYENCFFPKDSTFVSNLPVIKIETGRQRIHDSKRIKAVMSIDSSLQDSGAEDIFKIKIMIEIRGSSSQNNSKKSYSFHLIDQNEVPMVAPLLGMPPESEWILYAPYSDKTLLRDVIAYKISRDLGRYASQTVFVELFINNKYAGVYVLEEKIKRSEMRINAGSPKEKVSPGTTITGGYILRIDRPGDATRFVKPGKLSRYVGNQSRISEKKDKKKAPAGVRQPRKCDAEENYIESSYKPNGASWQTVDFHFFDPPADSLSTQQKLNLCNIMYNIESSLVDPFPLRNDSGYHRLIDMQSFIDYFIVSEVTRNIDSYRLSTYFYLAPSQMGSKMVMGPVWDFNLAMGNVEYCEGYMTSGWAYEYNYTCNKDPWLVPFWWERLIDDPVFRSELKCKWLNLRENKLSTEALMNFIDEQVTLLGDAPHRNFRKWHILGKDVWPNKYVFNSYPEEISFLKQWLTERLDWLDRNMPGDCTGNTFGNSK